jgi:ribosome-binding protein aMBF1 (putative translation factor)
MITRLKVAIDKSGLKQNWIADRLDIDETMLSHYVRGERVPPKSILRALSILLHTRKDRLVGVVE